MKSKLLLLAVVAAMPVRVALAGVGATWTTAGAQQFAKGKLQGVSVLSTGEVELAPETEEIKGLEAEFVWDLAAAEDGAVYAATGSPGAVYTVREDRAELLYKSDQKQVLSVLPLADGSVLAGTAPQGVIYRINRGGEVSIFANLEATYVWDMALGPRNEIYCATGPEGKLFRLNRAGEGGEVLKAKQKNIMCVTVGPDGVAYAGTDSGGYVYRIGLSDKATVLYDADEDEVHALVLAADGALYACTAQGGPGTGSRRPRGENSNDSSEEAAPPFMAPPAAGAPSAANSLYRIVPDRGAERLLRLDKAFLLSLAPYGDQVLVGTGTGGRVLGVGPGVRSRIITDFDASHVSAMAALPGGDVIVGTANAGGLHRLTARPRRSGTFLSAPFDAQYLSRWGRIWWRQAGEGGRSVRLRLRTGNGGEPDEHWSDWSEWVDVPAGGPVDTPVGRFAQFGAELSGSVADGTPRLLQVNVSYLQDNRRPRIEGLMVNGEAVLGQANGNGPRSGSRPTGPTRQARPQGAPHGRMLIAWRASDPNDDDLAFDLHYRGLDEADWKEIETDLKDAKPHAWDTSRVPDGHYLLKLVASDHPSRPGPEALADEKVTPPVLVDNCGPGILDLRASRNRDGTFELTGTARDEHSRVLRIEVSRNSGDWEPVFPVDGMLDSPQEPFRYVAKELDPGEHVFVFAAMDENENTGSGKLVVHVDAEP